MAYNIGKRLDPATGAVRGYYVNLPAAAAGRRRQLSFPTHAEAKDWDRLAGLKGLPHALAAYDAANRRGAREVPGMDGGRVVFADLAKAYVESRGHSGSRASYRSRLQVIGAYEPFAVIPAAALTRDDVEAFARWLTTHRAPRTGRVIAPNSQHAAYAFVGQVLRRSVRRGGLAIDATMGVENKPSAPTADESRDISQVIGQRDLEAILSHLTHPASDLFYRVVWATGMRTGEAAALSPGDVVVEGERAHLQVRRTWTKDDQRRRILGKVTKGRRRRDVSVPVALAKELAAHEATVLDPDQAPFTRTVADRTVYFPKPDVLRWDWERARNRAAAEGSAPEGVRPHDLRHSHVTHLLRAGVPPHIVSKRVGHSTTAFTQDRYGHVIPEDEDTVVGIVEQGLG